MIKVLDSFVADKIAAGEVIERPVSAIKELIENSIDAGASSIIIEIRHGGKTCIRVTDDGCGIAYDEAETAFLRHATSKISSIGDLDAITTLGFRGEALASISAVSRLTMISRTGDSPAGIKLVMHGGRIVSEEKTGANKGTTIIAEDLFYNTPARRKFMKSDAREASAVIELVQRFAIYYTDIRFMMINNGQTLFTTSGDGNAEAVIRTLYPELSSVTLLPVTGSTVKGYVSDPGSARSTRKLQLFFVNGRPVTSKLIEKALTDGYNGRIFSGYPPAFLFIDADPHEIDVNIHPGKLEIRFLRQDEVAEAIRSAVSEAVMSREGVPSASLKTADITAESKSADYIPFSGAVSEDLSIARPVSEQTSIREYLSGLSRPAGPAASDKTAVKASEPSFAEAGSSGADAAADHVSEDAPVYRPFDFEELIFKGYIFDTYIIMQSRDSVYLFDQHAAHERVFYERFMEGYKKSSHLPQPVLTPFTINVSADVYSFEKSWLDDVKQIGYDISDFGQGTFIIRGIPEYMNAEEASGFIKGYMEALDEAGTSNDTVRDKLIMRSCKSAVKGGEHLSESEIEALMKDLAACENPFSCPHGRPTFIKAGRYDIERAFRRK